MKIDFLINIQLQNGAKKLDNMVIGSIYYKLRERASGIMQQLKVQAPIYNTTL